MRRLRKVGFTKIGSMNLTNMIQEIMAIILRKFLRRKKLKYWKTKKKNSKKKKKHLFKFQNIVNKKKIIRLKVKKNAFEIFDIKLIYQKKLKKN